MKVLKNLAIGLAAVLVGVLFTACPTPQGTISITIDPAGDMEVEPGQVVTWNVTLAPDSAMSSALGDFYVIANSDTVFSTNLNGATDTKTFQISLTVPEDAPNGEVINVQFVAVDALSKLESSVSVKLTVNGETYVTQDQITMEWNTTSLDNTMMLVLTKDGISLEGGTSTAGQIAYMYNGDASILNTLASPNADEIAQAYSYNNITYTTDDKQETYFQRVTDQYTWDAIGQTDCENINIDATTSSLIANSSSLGYGVSTLAVGDIIAFYNPATNVKGFIKVDSYSTAKGEKLTTTLTVDIKYIAVPVSQTAK